MTCMTQLDVKSTKYKGRIYMQNELFETGKRHMGDHRLLHIAMKLILLPVAIVLTIVNYVFCFAGGVVCYIAKFMAVLFVMGGILLVISEPLNFMMGWQAILIGALFGRVPIFLKNFGSAILSGIVGVMRRV